MPALDYSLTVLTQVLIMAILTAIGFFVTKAGKFSKKTAEDMTFVVFKIATPAVIMKSFIEVDFTADYLAMIAMAALLALISHLLGLAAGLVFLRMKHCENAAVYRFGCLISNAGFIALPLAQATLDAESVLLVSVYVIVLNIFTWTIGKAYFEPGGKLGIMNILINPGTLGVMGGLVMLIIKLFGMPELISDTVNAVAAINAPMAMMITGYYLVGTDIRAALRDGRLWLVLAFRHILLPVAAMLLYRYAFGIGTQLLCAAIIPLCAPCAVIVIMMAASTGGDQKTACRMASVSTILSVVTMPLVLTLCMML
ncbi:MAG: hypothetical protein E7632_01850 [Ruminococcaceae bacterium]|nr:hypothetical protein [Oscillospiraceae bacterium]